MAVEVWGPATRRVWPGSDPRLIPNAFSATRVRALANRLNRIAGEGGIAAVWVSKGFPSSLKLVSRLSDLVLVVADFDDHDIALARTFISKSLSNRARLNRFREGSPQRIARSQRGLLRRAELVTSSSHELARVLELPSPHVRIPHARPRISASRIANRDHLRLGFFGTMRPHKGLEEILSSLKADRRLTLTTFRQRNIQVPSDMASRWVEIDGRTSLGEAYSLVDVAVLPMDMSAMGARVQLPAKAIDAAASATPMAATPTPVMVEYFGDSFARVDNWGTLGDRLWQARESGLLDRWAIELRDIWEEELSVEVISRLIRDEFVSLRSWLN